jgi:hypothetical protein
MNKEITPNNLFIIYASFEASREFYKHKASAALHISSP